jgi:hypothetical protein
MTKLTPSLEKIWTAREIEALSTTSFQPDRPYCPFMTSPGADCTSAEPEKRRVWPRGAIRFGKCQQGYQSEPIAISHEIEIVHNGRKCSLFKIFKSAPNNL